MLLTPRYDDPGFFRLECPLGDPAVPLMRQRRRLAGLLATFDDESWAAPSRCEGWSAQDVIAHLVTTNQFWAFSINAGRGDEPTRVLTTFDPVTSPAGLVQAARSQSPAETVAQFIETNDALAAAVAGLDDDGWSLLGEAPPGHVPLRAVALHAMWDSWVHERDIVLPRGLTPVEEPDEVCGCLVYGAALSPAFAVGGGEMRRGAIAVDTSDPGVRLVVEVDNAVVVRTGDAPAGALVLSGTSVEMLEALSFRVPLPSPIAPDQRWLLDGLARVFDMETEDSPAT